MTAHNNTCYSLLVLTLFDVLLQFEFKYRVFVPELINVVS